MPGPGRGRNQPALHRPVPKDKTHRLNILHAWWPGGLILGGIAGYAITRAMGLDTAGLASGAATLGWRIKLALIMVPAFGFVFLVRGQRFPQTERVAAGVGGREMFREALRPMFLLLFVCMWMTAATEIGPDQWVASLITNLTGMQGVLILVYTAGIVFALRFFRRRLIAPAVSARDPDAFGGAVLRGASRAFLRHIAGERIRCGHVVRRWQNILLARDAWHDRRAIPEGGRAPARDDGRGGEPCHCVHPARDGPVV